MTDLAVAPADQRMFLTRDECFLLLDGDALGHVNFTRHAMPNPLRMRCAVHGQELVLREDARTGLGRLLDAAEVALQVDVIDRTSQAAWRVVVVGLAATSRQDDRLVRVRPTDVTGHRLPDVRTP
jgi:hypothetical protein